MSHRTLAVIGIVLGIAIALGIAAIALLDSDGGVRLEPGYFGTLPIVALAALPALLATLGLKRPPALLAAGILTLPTAFLSFAGVTLPLLIPGALYLVAYGRAPVSRPRVRPGAIAAVVTVMAIGALFVSFGGGQMVCRETKLYPDGTREVRETTDNSSGMTLGGGSDDEAVSIESSCSTEPSTQASTASLLLTVGAVFGAGWMSKPSERDLFGRTPA